MGLLDRLWGTGRDTVEVQSTANETAEKRATRLLEEGMALEEQARLDEALSCYQAAIQMMPELARAHFNRGNILLDRGDAEEALAAYTQAVAYKPDSAAAYYNIGNAHLHLDHPDAAITAYTKAIELKSEFADAHVALGGAQEVLGQLEAAAASYQRALNIRPDSADIHFVLGGLLSKLGRLDEAASSYRRLLEIEPGRVEVYSRLGLVQHNLGQLDEAEESYGRALEMAPDLVEAHGNLGNVLRDLGRFEDAVASYLRVLEIEPDSAKAYNNLGCAFTNLGRTDEALVSFRRALEIEPDFPAAHSNLLFCLSHSEVEDAQVLFSEHRRFATQFEAPLQGSWSKHRNLPVPDRSLQIGFVSADLRQHAVASFIEPVLANLMGKQGLSMHAYYNHTIVDSTTRRMQTYFSDWHPVAGLSDAELAQEIRRARIDILIDLSSHTAMHRLLCFARKPAPVQVSWIGYPGTTGLKSMDYYLSDRYFLPPGVLDDQFTEKIVRLPASATFLPFDDAPLVNGLPASINGHITFGSFNRTDKVNRSVIRLWSQLLRALPHARMLLGAMPTVGDSETLIKFFAAEGIVSERLSFYPKSEMKEYLALHHRVDVCLDTFPYNGGTTTLQALWMGVPTLSLAGRTAAGRTGASILSHIGLEKFIAQDEENFVQKGLFWARSLPVLSEIRACLRDRVERSVLCRSNVVATALEYALRIMWSRWCAGLPPESFEVTLQDVGNEGL